MPSCTPAHPSGPRASSLPKPSRKRRSLFDGSATSGTGSALPWLYVIARNLVRTFYERERIETRARARLGMPLRSYESDLEETNDRVDADRLAPALTDALATLPPAQRQAVELRIVRDLPYAQIALSLGCSEVAARVRVTRALRSLSYLLKGASS